MFVTVFVLDANCNWQDQGKFSAVATHALKWMPFCAELGDEGFQGNQPLPLCLQFTCYVSNSVDILGGFSLVLNSQRDIFNLLFVACYLVMVYCCLSCHVCLFLMLICLPICLLICLLLK